MNSQNLTARARGLFPNWADVEALPAGLRMLAAFAAQNPGLDFADYGDVTAYRGDARRITGALRDVREAMASAYYAGVTDEHLIEASRGDRLTVERMPSGALRLDYTTGQYWPMEYRGAVARLLQRAARIAANEGGQK